MDLLNHAWRSFPTSRQYIKTHINKKWSSRNPRQLNENPFHEIHVGLLFAVTCNRLFETLLFYRKTKHRMFCKFHTYTHFLGNNQTRNVTSDITKLKFTLTIGRCKHWPKEAVCWARHSYQSATSALPTIKPVSFLMFWQANRHNLYQDFDSLCEWFSWRFLRSNENFWPNKKIVSKQSSLFWIILVI